MKGDIAPSWSDAFISLDDLILTTAGRRGFDD